MPACKNGNGFYTGKEPSPKGLGYCAKSEKVGIRKRGRNKNMWVVKVIKCKSKKYKRWVPVKTKVTKIVKTQKHGKKHVTKQKTSKKSKTSKSSKNKSNNKSKKTKRLRGGEVDEEFKMALANAFLYIEPMTENLENIINRYIQKVGLGKMSQQDVMTQLERQIKTFQSFANQGHNVGTTLRDFQNLHTYLANGAQVPKPTQKSQVPSTWMVNVRDISGKNEVAQINFRTRVADTLRSKGFGQKNKVIINGQGLKINPDTTWQDVQDLAINLTGNGIQDLAAIIVV